MRVHGITYLPKRKRGATILLSGKMEIKAKCVYLLIAAGSLAKISLLAVYVMITQTNGLVRPTLPHWYCLFMQVVRLFSF